MRYWKKLRIDGKEQWKLKAILNDNTFIWNDLIVDKKITFPISRSTARLSQMSFYESKLRKPVVGNQRISFKKRKGTILNAHVKKFLNYFNILYIRRLLRLVVLHLDENLRVQEIPALDLYLQISFPCYVLLGLFI